MKKTDFKNLWEKRSIIQCVDWNKKQTRFKLIIHIKKYLMHRGKRIREKHLAWMMSASIGRLIQKKLEGHDYFRLGGSKITIRFRRSFSEETRSHLADVKL